MKFVRDGKPYIIAEIGANHNGDMGLARRLVRAAKDAGADCVKFQSWDVNLFAKEVYDKNDFNPDRPSGEPTLRETMERYSMTPQKLRDMAAFAREIGIDCASTPFEVDQVAIQVELQAPFIKIASMDVVNDHLLAVAARTGKTVLLSTGLAGIGEIEHALGTLESNGATDIVLLHCVALYPPKDEEVNLRNIVTLSRTFGRPIGFSDHTLGIEVPLAAAALGAVVIEKHFTLDKTMAGWDHSISADPPELKAIVDGAKRIHAALGAERRVVTERDIAQRKNFRRSVVTARTIKKGERLTLDHLTYRRPGTGIEPNRAGELVGLIAAHDIPENALLKMTDLRIAG